MPKPPECGAHGQVQAAAAELRCSSCHCCRHSHALCSCDALRRGIYNRTAAGPALPGTQLRIVDPATYQDLPDGEQGLVLAKGGWWGQPYRGSFFCSGSRTGTAVTRHPS